MRYGDAIMQQINWDNLRYVLMVANKGSIASAARELSVNRTTVLRRIKAFQDDLNCRIFERVNSGYILTREAEKMLEAAQEVENTLFDMQRQIAGHELRLEGVLRVTTTDTLMVSVVGPHLANFHRKHPDIVVEMVMTNSILDLNRRDADIAIRPTKTPELHLVGCRVSDIRFGVYGAKSYLKNRNHLKLSSHTWIGFDASLQSTPLGRWFDSNVPAARVCMRGDSFVAIRIAAENGIGLALLPHYLGESSKLLQPLVASISDLTTGLWLLTHPDLIRSARVHAFMDHFEQALSDL